MFVYCSIGLIAFLCYYFLWKPQKMVDLADKLKCGNKTLPVIGHAIIIKGANKCLMDALHRISRQAYKNTYGMISIWFANRLFISISDADAAATILKNSLDKSYMAYFVKDLLQGGSVVAPVEKWRPRRKLIAPMFSHTNLIGFLNIFINQSNTLVDCLAKGMKNGDISAMKYMIALTFDSISETTFGMKIGAQQKGYHPFSATLENIFKLIIVRICRPWLHFDFIYRYSSLYAKQKLNFDYVHKFIKDVYRQKELEMQKQANEPTKQPDKGYATFLELSIKGGQPVEAICEEALVFLVAGSDTSATALSFMSVLLSVHPDVQQRVYEEIESLFGEDDTVTYEKLKKLKYMDAFIMESLRLYPPGPFLYRYCDKDVEMPKGLTFYRGVHCIINVWAIQRNRLYWGRDAEEFKPERFLGNFDKYPNAYLPFSLTPRNCMGYNYVMMSMKTTLTKMLLRFRILPASDMVDKLYKPLNVKINVMLRHTDEFKIRLENRKP